MGFKLKIVTPEKVFFEGEVDILNIKLTKGDVIKSVYVVNDTKVLNIVTSENNIDINVGELPLTSSVSTGQKMIPARSGIVLKTRI